MKAYFVTNSGYDSVVIPETGQALTVDDVVFADFIRDLDTDESLDFADWVGEATDLAPEDLGTVLAVRDDTDGQPPAVNRAAAEEWTRRCAYWLHLA